MNNQEVVIFSLIQLHAIEVYLEQYDADKGSEQLKDKGPILCAQLRGLLEEARHATERHATEPTCPRTDPDHVKRFHR